MGSLKKYLDLIVAFLALCSDIVLQMIKVYHSYFTIIVILTIILFIIINKCLKIQKAQETRLGVTKFIYSVNERKNAKMVTIVSSVLIPVIVISILYYHLLYKNKISEKDIGIIITEFSNSGNDLFTNDLYNDLSNQSYIKESDSIKVNIYNGFLAVQPNKNADTLINIFRKYKLSKGLLVFGERDEDKLSDEKIFRCMVYVNNLKGLMVDSVMVDEGSDEKVIYIKTPTFIDLKLKAQTKKISAFILGLLQFNSKQFERSEETFNSIIKGADSSNTNKKWIGACMLFSGSSNAINGKLETAMQQFIKGIEADSTNAHLYYNLAALKALNKNLDEAYVLFKKANDLDKNLSIPALDFKSGNNISDKKQLFDAKNIDAFSIDNPELKNRKFKSKLAKLDTTSTNFPVLCKELKLNDNTFELHDIPYIILFNANPAVQFYLDQKNDLLIFNEEGRYMVVGQMFQYEKGRGLKDFCKNTWAVDDKGYIISNKGVIGKLYPQKQ